MIFVNTSIDVALERNEKRARSLQSSFVIQSWKEVQANIGAFNNMFRKGFIVIDNNDADEDVFQLVWKRIQGLLRKKVTNTRSQNWIASELTKKKR